MKTQRRWTAVTCALAILTLAAGRQLAMLVEVSPLQAAEGGTLTEVVVRVAPEDRVALGRDVMLWAELTKDGQRVTRRGWALKIDDPAVPLRVELIIPDGKHVLRVDVEGSSSRSKGVWWGDVDVTIPSPSPSPSPSPVAVPETATVAVSESVADLVPVPVPVSDHNVSGQDQQQVLADSDQRQPTATSAADGTVSEPDTTDRGRDARATTEITSVDPDPDPVSEAVTATESVAATEVVSVSVSDSVADLVPVPVPVPDEPALAAASAPATATGTAVAVDPEPDPGPETATAQPVVEPAADPDTAAATEPDSATVSVPATAPETGSVTVSATVAAAAPALVSEPLPTTFIIAADLHEESAQDAAWIGSMATALAQRVVDGPEAVLVLTHEDKAGVRCTSWPKVAEEAISVGGGSANELPVLVVAALESIDRDGENPVVLVLTDGLGPRNRKSWTDAQRTAKQVGVPVLIAGFWGEGFPSGARKDLRKLAEVSGGSVFYVQGRDQADTLVDRFVAIVEE